MATRPAAGSPFGEHTPHGRSTRAPTVSDRGMVVSAHPLASQAGLAALRDGGTAVDAVVAVAATLNVVEPYMSGVGGVGIAQIHDPKTGTSRVLNFSGRAPGRAQPRAFDARTKAIGARAVLVPGNVAGWSALHRAHGSLPWSRCFRDAIELAERGHRLTPFSAALFRANWGFLTEYGSLRTAFLGDLGDRPEAGARFRQPALAKTLATIAAEGGQAFYHGRLGDDIVTALEQAGGLLDREDLASYAPEWQQPLGVPYRDHEILVPPPNCSAFQIAETMRILDGFAGSGQVCVESIHGTLEAIKLAIADRLAWAGDPDFNAIPLDSLLSARHATDLRARIDPSRASAPPRHRFSEDYRDTPDWWRQGMTTHFVAADQDGMVATVSQTLGNVFGCGIAVPGAGVLLNNMALWFDVEPDAPPANRIAPNKRVDFCLSPCHLTRAGRIVASVGTPGSYGILQTVVQVLRHLVDGGVNIQEAIEAPRYRLMESGEVLLEGRYPIETVEALRARGHRARSLPQAWSRLFGGAHGIALSDSGALFGGADPRRDGVALGW